MTKTITLKGGAELPLIGLGTWPMDDAEATRVVAEAIQLGYRHVDTAENYGNEAGVGAGVLASGVPREDVWVTTKFNKEWHTDPAGALQASLERLGLDYVDLFLIHWPNPDQDRYVDAWKGLLALREQGAVKAIGTSNFTPDHLQRLYDETGYLPEVNQIECHPYLPRIDERTWHREHGIVTEAWSPLGRGGKDGLLMDATVIKIAEAHGITAGQVVLAWDVQQDIVTIPKSSDTGRLKLNLESLDVQLSADELIALSSITPPPGIEHLDPLTFGH